MKKNDFIMIRLSKEEKAKIEKEAKKHNLTKTEFVRMCIFKTLNKIVSTEEVIADLLNKLSDTEKRLKGGAK